MGEGCSIETMVYPCPPPDRLEPLWRGLEDRCDAGVFRSWAWIGCVLDVFAPRALVVEARCAGRVVGLALVGLGKAAFPGGRPRGHLGETGLTEHDRIMIEYNGVLAEPGWAAPVSRAVLDALLNAGSPRCGELRLSGVDGQWFDLCRHAGVDWRLLRLRQGAPYADLRAMDATDPLRSLSKNSREQIRRSIRRFEDIGPVGLSRAESIGQSLEWFRDLEFLHTASWTRRGNAGAFGGKDFAAFHRRLIARTFDQGVVDLLRLSAGKTVLGYLYNLRWHDRVYAYQSGFTHADDPRWRPGLVAHLLAMRRYGNEKISVYHFLAGDARYKQSLSNGSDTLYWMAAYRSSLLRRIEDLARRFLRPEAASGPPTI